jgi:hypothetical protein
MTTDVSSSTTDGVATSSTPSELDLAFIIDATSSMSPYIRSAQNVCILIFWEISKILKNYFLEYVQNYSRYYFK